ncbi:MAG: hypothetical protein HPY85_09220 [Anaerolineae bacterium]|nr:hypothetical protein [Anaerolineae bacterium]
MAIHYTFAVINDTLHVTTTGMDETTEEVLAYKQAVIRAGITGNVRKILLDETGLVYRISLGDTYASAAAVAEAAPRVVRVALVPRPQGYQDGAFWETVVVNRGLTARVFPDVESAHAWLQV